MGGFVFARGVWRPAATSSRPSAEASAAFAARSRRLLLGACLGGVFASALGIVLQGATASGGPFWSALDPSVVDDVLGTRFGTVWGLRLVAFAVLGAVFATGGWALPAAALGVLICLTPALAGHSSTIHPSALLVPANTLYVSAMAIWVGGVASLALALPAATSRLAFRQRSALLAEAVARFSAIAIWAVAALVASGVLQAIVELDAVADLWDSAFGRAILVKVGLVDALVAIGAWNRTRARPRLAAHTAEGASTGATGVVLRRALRGELVLMAGVFAATAALASYAPPSAATGPFSAHEDLGPARLELTVDPARAGPNQIHLYLFDRRSGAQFKRAKELDLSASRPDHGIGPLKLDAQTAGPGHWIVRGASLAPAGKWTLAVAARVSEFDEYTTKVEVPVR